MFDAENATAAIDSSTVTRTTKLLRSMCTVHPDYIRVRRQCIGINRPQVLLSYFHGLGYIVVRTRVGYWRIHCSGLLEG